MFFVPGEEDEPMAELVYMKQGTHTMIIEHTGVSEALRGQNVGYELVKTAIEYAKAHHLKVIPMCTFAKAIIDRKPEFRDVVG